MEGSIRVVGIFKEKNWNKSMIVYIYIFQFCDLMYLWISACLLDPALKDWLMNLVNFA